MDYLADLNDAQRDAVLHTSGPLLIVAGAGAGKTKTITHRIAHLIASGVPPRSILAVTFTNKAAAEMRDRIHRLLMHSTSPYVSTFHSLGVRLLREFATEADIPRNFAIWDRDDSVRVIKRHLTEHELEQRFSPRQVLARISKEKGNGTTLDEWACASSYENVVAEAWRAYEAVRVKEGALDFDDLLLQSLVLLKTNAGVRATLIDRWRHLTIDEYQDTNRSQLEIARLLTSEAQNICAVGDTDQVLYSWRGADVKNLLSFEATFPGTRVILLEQNYRSTQTILTAANAVIAKNVLRFPKRLFTNNATGEAIRLYAGESERDEAQFAARTARELMGSGVPASEIALLFRENFQSRALEESFIREGIPYRVLGTRFFERAEVKDVLSYVRAALNPRSTIDFARAAGTPSRGIGKTTLEKVQRGAALTGSAAVKMGTFTALLSRIAEKIRTAPASEALHFVITESGLEKSFGENVEDAERLKNVIELVSHATRYDSAPAPEGIEKLLEDASLMSDQDELEERKEAVTLMTVHASKGLEFDAVMVTGLEQGLFPAERQSDTDRDSEEERRLFYVAITRARKHLYLTCAASRLKYGSREYAAPSSFLADIDERLLVYAEREHSILF